MDKQAKPAKKKEFIVTQDTFKKHPVILVLLIILLSIGLYILN